MHREKEREEEGGVKCIREKRMYTFTVQRGEKTLKRKRDRLSLSFSKSEKDSGREGKRKCVLLRESKYLFSGFIIKPQ